MRPWCVGWILVGACGAANEDPAASPTKATDSATVSTTDTAAGERPVITSADAWCYFHETGEQYYGWDVAAEITDPQGADTVPSGIVVIEAGGVEVASRLLACNGDAARCTTAFREDTDGVSCAEAALYQFRFTVTDEDDHVSEPVEVTGRQQ